MARLEGALRDGDVLSGLALAGLGTFILVNARQWIYLGPDGPGPGFFPSWYGALMIVLSLGLVVSRVLRPARGPAAPTDWAGLGRALAAWTGFVISISLLNVIGFAASLALLCLFLSVCIFGRRLREGLIAAVVIAAAFHLVFATLLDVSLPAGPWGF